MFKAHRSYDLTTGVKSKTIAVFNSGSKIRVLYHKTIVVYASKRQIILDNGGWDTVSTRHVINTALYELGSSYRLVRNKGKTKLIQNEYQKPSQAPDFVPGVKIPLTHGASPCSI